MKQFHVESRDNKLIGNAGLIHVGRFAKKLGLKNILERHLSISSGENAKYDVTTCILMLVIGVIGGVRHLSHLLLLKADTVIRKLFGWESFPHPSTFGRLFKLFRQVHCHELSEAENEVRRKVWSKKWFGLVTLDLDSSVQGVYGFQEGASKGYNPHKKGQRSYHPLFCFMVQTGECLYTWFRAGDAYSGNGAEDFIKECYSRLPKRVVTLLLEVCPNASNLALFY